MTTLTNSIPDYEPKTDWKDFKKIEMNIRDLQQNYIWDVNVAEIFTLQVDIML